MFNTFLILFLVLTSIILSGTFLYKNLVTKLIFLNTGTSVSALFICFLGSLQVNSSYVDIALIYFLLSVVTNNAYLKYFVQQKRSQKNAR